MDLLRQVARVARGGGVVVGTQREGVDLLARQLVAVGHVLRGLHHLDVRVAGQQGWVGRAAGAGPHRVEHEHGTARGERRLALHQRPSRAGHRLDAGGEPDGQLVRADRVSDRNRTGQRGGAEAVDGDRGNRVREAGGQRGPPRDVAHPLVRRVHAPCDDVFDSLERDVHPLACPHHRLAKQIIDPDV